MNKVYSIALDSCILSLKPTLLLNKRTLPPHFADGGGKFSSLGSIVEEPDVYSQRKAG